MSIPGGESVESKRFLFEPPGELDDLVDGPELLKDGSDVELRLSYVREGIAISGALRFAWVRGIRFSAEPVCRAFQITGCYGLLVEVESSEWIRVLVDGHRASHLDLNHFMIYVPDSGCYEFAAESWSFREEPYGERP